MVLLQFGFNKQVIIIIIIIIIIKSKPSDEKNSFFLSFSSQEQTFDCNRKARDTARQHNCFSQGHVKWFQNDSNKYM